MAILCAEKKCRKYFSSKDALLDHWSQRSSTDEAIPDHFHCKECVKLFDSKLAEEAHQTQTHLALKSSLACPWCQWGCVNLSSFVGHFELNHCPVITKVKWQQMRKNKLAVSEELQKRHYGDDPDIINNPCEGVMGTRRPGAPPISELSALRPPVSSTVRPNPVLLNSRASPSFPSRASDPAYHRAQLPAATAPGSADTKENLYADHDPANPRFDPYAYYEPLLEKFKCPHKFCMKKFKTINQFKDHLNSSHKDSVRYQCPICFRFLDTLFGLAAHIENPTAKCGVRQTREYGHLVSQLSCGLVELNKDFFVQDGEESDDDDRYVGQSTAYGANGGGYKRPAEFIMSPTAQKPKPVGLTAGNVESVDELAQAVGQGLNFTEKTDEQLENERGMEKNDGFFW